MRESTQQQIEIHDTSSFGFNKLMTQCQQQQQQQQQQLFLV
jgi:hypothetical protein